MYHRYLPVLSWLRWVRTRVSSPVAEVACFGEVSDPDGAAAGVELDVAGRSVLEGDGLGFESGAFLFAASVFAAWLFGFRGGDSVDGQEAEVSQQGLVVDAA